VGLECEIGRFVDSNDHQLYLESLDNSTQTDVWFGRVKEIPSRREETRCRTTLEARRRQDMQSLMLTA
jgi:hypothetical protein